MLFGMLLRHSPNNVCYSRIVRSASIPNNIHITLVMLAYAFLVSICLQQPTHPVSHQEPPTCSPLLPLTASEVRHLLAHLFFPAPTSVPLIFQWSSFRRAHQYWAGYYHRRRRQKAGSV